MTNIKGKHLKKAKWMLAFLAFLLNFKIVLAQTVVTPATNAAGLCVGDDYITLDNIYIEETDTEDFAAGDNQSYIGSLPAGFEFEAGQGQAIPYLNKGDFSAWALVVSKNSFILTYDLVPGNGSNDGFVITGLKIKATALAEGDLLRTGGNASQNSNGLGDAQSMAALKSFAPPTASIASNKTDNRICEGEPITFTAKTGDWFAFYVNGNEVQAFSQDSIFTTSDLENGDMVKALVQYHNGCQSFSPSISMVVQSKPDVTIFGLEDEYCGNDGPVNLIGFPSSAASGTFSGPGITNLSNGKATFNPANVALDQLHTIYYSYTNSKGCENSFSQDVWVNSLPSVSIGEKIKISFKDDDINNYQLDGEIVSTVAGKASSPAGGVYSGNGVNAGFFYPAVAGVGSHTIFYTYTDTLSKCAAQASFKVEVFDIDQGKITGLTESSYCENNAVLDLQGVPSIGGTPGGVISGQGIVSFDKTAGTARFSPQGLGGRNITLKYVFTNRLGLPDSVFQTVEILKIPDVSFVGDDLTTRYCAGFYFSEDIKTQLSGGTASAKPGTSFEGFGIRMEADTAYSFSTYSALNDYLFAYSRDTMLIPEDMQIDISPDYMNLTIDDDYSFLKNLSEDEFIDWYDYAVSRTELSYYYNDFMRLFAALDKLKESTRFNVKVTKKATDQGCTSQTSITVSLFLPPKKLSINGLNASYCLNSVADTLQGFPTGGSFSGRGIVNLAGGKALFVPDSINTQRDGYEIEIKYLYTGSGGCVTKHIDYAYMADSIPNRAEFNMNLYIPQAPGGVGPSVNKKDGVFQLCSSSGEASISFKLFDEKNREMNGFGVYIEENAWVEYYGGDGKYYFNPANITLQKDTLVKVWLVAGAESDCETRFSFDVKISASPITKITPASLKPCAGTDKLKFTVSPYSALDQVKLFKSGSQGGQPQAVASALAKDSVISLLNLPSGKYTLVYFYRDTVQNCSSDAHSEIEIISPTTMAFPTSPKSFCTNGPDFVLEAKQFMAGGVFSGVGITNLGNGKAVIKPSGVPQGTYVHSYKYFDEKGCQGVVTQAVTFYEPKRPVISAGSGKFCFNAGVQSIFAVPSELDANGNKVGTGTFSGPGLTKTADGKANFDPVKAGVGTHSLVYTYTSIYEGSLLCTLADTQKVTVFAVPQIKLTIAQDTVCNNQSGEIKLKGTAVLGADTLCKDGAGIYTVKDPSGTVKSSGDTFTPFGKKAGNYLIRFSCGKQYDGVFCDAAVEKNIVVKDPPVLAIKGLESNYCENSFPDTITAEPFNASARFSGNGIKNISPGKAVFTPADANEDEGNYITYAYTNGIGCVTTLTDSVYVTATPKPVFGFFDLNKNRLDLDANGKPINEPTICVSSLALVAKGDSTGVGVFGVFSFEGTVTARAHQDSTKTYPFTLLRRSFPAQNGMATLPANAIEQFMDSSFLALGVPGLKKDRVFVKAAVNVYYTIVKNGCTGISSKKVLFLGLPALDLKIAEASLDNKVKNEASRCGSSDSTYRVTSNVYEQSGTWVLKRDGLVIGKSTAAKPTLDYRFKLDSLPVGRRLFTYEFTLAEGGCLNIVSTYINILPLPKAEIKKLNACDDTNASFQGKLTDESVNAGIKAKSWSWKFPDAEPSTSSMQNPSNIRFKVPGKYFITLTVESENGCIFTKKEEITVGKVPEPKFSWANTCLGETVLFNDNTAFNSPTDTITKWQWDFGDGTPVSNEKIPAHAYAKYGSYKVTLSLTSKNNCTGTLSQTVHIYPSVEVTRNAPYNSSFATGRKGWVGQGTNSSWKFGIDTSFSALAGDSLWATGIDSFNTDENSWVEGPCFDLSSLEKPMLSMNISLKFGSESDLHGAVLMAFADGDKDWNIVGEIGKGINWYTYRNIKSNPGGYADNNIAWSGDSNGKWVNARFGLDQYKGKSSVRFRVKFASKNNTRRLKGFAFKDFIIKEREKGVLLEHFTNKANTISYNQTVFDAYQKDLVPIHYHTDYPGPDPLNADRPQDPNGRALYYGVLETPRSVLEGKAYNGPATDWKATTLDSLSLKSPGFDIALTLEKAKSNIKAALTSRIAVTDPVALRLAIIENPVGTNKYVLRRMLPDAAGHIFRTAGLWKVGDIASADFTWAKFTSQNLSNVGLVAFVQNEKTKEIYQSIYIAPQQLTGLVTALEEGVGVSWLQLYPNPAEESFTLSIGEGAKNGFAWEVYSATGAKLMSGNTPENSCSVEVGSLPSGVYLIKVDAGENASAVKRFVVKH